MTIEVLPSDKGYTLAQLAREKIIFGDPGTCYLLDPQAKLVQVLTDDGVLKWIKSKYLSPEQKLNNRKILASLYGAICQHCGTKLSLDKKDKDRPNYATIEHLPEVDGQRNPFHNCIHCNLLYCFSCNSSGRAKKAIPVKTSTEEVRERKASHADATEQLKEKVDYSQGSTEVQINGEAEVDFRRWIEEQVTSYGKLAKKQAIDGGAEVFGVNPTTSRRYLDKMISDYGDFETYRDPDEKKFYIRKKPEDLLKLTRMSKQS